MQCLVITGKFDEHRLSPLITSILNWTDSDVVNKTFTFFS